MATYVTLYNFTEQGLRDIKGTVKRLEANRKAASEAGITFKEVLWLEGAYDLMVVVEAPDEKAAIARGLSVAKQGYVRGQTLRAFSAADMAKILEKVV
jgi:uncharacterized protein with GYD domain